jgi:dihydrofolate synthase/folylpolyglutamate synthase
MRDLLEELFQLRRVGIKPGLKTITNICEALGNPQKAYKVIHVAGTNGKGTTCSLIASVLTAAGYRTGLYTSPHIKKFNERIRVDGAEISDDKLYSMITSMLPLAEKLNGSFFEVTTAMAFQHFADSNVDIAVIEAGLGGRLDATNVVEPIATAITTIDFDHMDYLGDTLELIAKEKAGIMKQNVPCIVGEERTELQHVFFNAAVEKNVPVVMVDDVYRCQRVQYNKDLSMTLTVKTPIREIENLQVPLCGVHQVRNTLTAVAVFDFIKKSFPVSDTNICDGIASVVETYGLRARTQLLHQQPPYVIDVAHNPASVQSCIDTLGLCGCDQESWNIVFASMKDKPIEQMLESLRDVCATLFITKPNIERAEDTEAIQILATKLGMKSEVHETVSSAITSSEKQDAPTLILGSFYLIDEALESFV